MRWTAFLTLVALAVAAAVPSLAGAVSAQDAISVLNAERAANGIPAGITENPDWSAGCARHMNYIALNGGVITHTEDPSQPGYTPEGAQAGGTSVLAPAGYADSQFSAGTNPWENAPIHLMQMLGPGLAVTGYSDGCMYTWAGYTRTAPGPALYTYPGDGTNTIYASETAGEGPFVPGDFVGLPQGTTTGPHLFVLAFGTDSGTLTATSLTGPGGPVDVRTVDNHTSGDAGDLGSYLPPGGIIIPTHPLAVGTTYTASATFASDDNPQVVLTRTWSFATALPVPDVSATLDRSLATFQSDSTATTTATIRRAPSGAVVASHAFARVADEVSWRHRLPGGRYTVCFDQARSGEFGPAHPCASASWRSAPGLRLTGRRSSRRLTLTADAAVGRRAVLSTQRVHRVCRFGFCSRRAFGRKTRRVITMRPRRTVTVPSGRRLTITVSAFARGELLYAAQTVSAIR